MGSDILQGILVEFGKVSTPLEKYSIILWVWCEHEKVYVNI